MYQFLDYMFAPIGQPWYQGNIWPNILASIVIGVFIYLAHRSTKKLLRKQHTEHMEHHQILQEQITQLVDQKPLLPNNWNGQ